MRVKYRCPHCDRILPRIIPIELQFPYHYDIYVGTYIIHDKSRYGWKEGKEIFSQINDLISFVSLDSKEYVSSAHVVLSCNNVKDIARLFDFAHKNRYYVRIYDPKRFMKKIADEI